MSKDYLTTSQAAALLGVNASRVRQLLISGKLAGERVGSERRGEWRISREAVEGYKRGREK